MQGSDSRPHKTVSEVTVPIRGVCSFAEPSRIQELGARRCGRGRSSVYASAVGGVLIFEGSPPLGGLASSLAAKLRPPKVPFALGSASNRVSSAMAWAGRCREFGNAPVVRTLTHRRRRAGEPLGQED